MDYPRHLSRRFSIHQAFDNKPAHIDKLFANEDMFLDAEQPKNMMSQNVAMLSPTPQRSEEDSISLQSRFREGPVKRKRQRVSSDMSITLLM